MKYLYSVRKIRVGDFVTLKALYIKRKWRIPDDAEFEIIEVHPEDPTIFVGRYKGVKFAIFVESIRKIRGDETFILS